MYRKAQINRIKSVAKKSWPSGRSQSSLYAQTMEMCGRPTRMVFSQPGLNGRTNYSSTVQPSTSLMESDDGHHDELWKLGGRPDKWTRSVHGGMAWTDYVACEWNKIKVTTVIITYFDSCNNIISIWKAERIWRARSYRGHGGHVLCVRLFSV